MLTYISASPRYGLFLDMPVLKKIFQVRLLIQHCNYRVSKYKTNAVKKILALDTLTRFEHSFSLFPA
jgi:hypothetical protein